MLSAEPICEYCILIEIKHSLLRENSVSGYLFLPFVGLVCPILSECSILLIWPLSRVLLRIERDTTR